MNPDNYQVQLLIQMSNLIRCTLTLWTSCTNNNIYTTLGTKKGNRKGTVLKWTHQLNLKLKLFIYYFVKLFMQSIQRSANVTWNVFIYAILIDRHMEGRWTCQEITLNLRINQKRSEQPSEKELILKAWIDKSGMNHKCELIVNKSELHDTFF